MFYGHAMFIGCLSLSGLSLARLKITADILMTLAGEFFTEEIEDSIMLLNLKSTRCDSDKPEEINLSILPGCFL